MRMKYNFEKKKRKKKCHDAEIVSCKRYMEYGLCIKLTFHACMLLILFRFSRHFFSVFLWFIFYACDCCFWTMFFNTAFIPHIGVFTCYTNNNDLVWCFFFLIQHDYKWLPAHFFYVLTRLIFRIVIGMCCVLCYVSMSWVRAFSIYAM